MTESAASHSRWRTWLPVTLLVLVNIVVGTLTVKDYGRSTDEGGIQRYSRDTLVAYATVLKYHHLPAQYGERNLRFYGPAFFLTSEVATRILHRLGFGWDQTTIWHMLYFLSFQLAVASLYLLSRRWMSVWAAFGAALLFSTQPLLWGHAFINPKDMPFMGFFLASVAAGFAMVDWVAGANPFGGASAGSPSRFSGLKGAGARLGRQSLKGFTLPYVLFAGALLGFTTSIRILGPWAGVLVALYAIYKIPRLLAGVLVPYFTVTAAVTYLSWPFLWADPLRRFFGSLFKMSDFPFRGEVFFEGRIWSPHALPAYYLPKLMILQLTEVAILLFAFGLGVGVARGLRQKAWEPLWLFLLWFLLPVCTIIIFQSTVYDNFRQVLFVLPPVFIMAGLALDWIFGKWKNAYLRVGVLILMVVPGIVSIVRLHPYEYIYYNSLTGGVGGAFRKYQMDYWGTAYREAALYVNRVAPPNARVLLYTPYGAYTAFSSPKVKVYTTDQAKNLAGKGVSVAYDFAVLSTRFNKDLGVCQGQEIVKTVEREGAILAMVKKVSPGQTGCP